MTASKGFKVSFAVRPAAITTIIVSPITRDVANNKPPAIPGRAAGIITFFIASERVHPTASAPSLSEVGTAVMASSEIEETKGIVSYGKKIETEMHDFLKSELNKYTSENKIFQCTI